MSSTPVCPASHEAAGPAVYVRPVAPIRRIERELQPNDRCPCGSGKKVKRCCGLPESCRADIPVCRPQAIGMPESPTLTLEAPIQNQNGTTNSHPRADKNVCPTVPPA